MADWITPDDVAGYLDLPGDPDENVVLATAAVRAAVERRRADLVDDDGEFVPGDDVRYGSIVWAAILVQSRAAPSGFAGYGDTDATLYDALGARRAEILRLIGFRRPVTF